MARFRAYASDSSDDDETSQPAHELSSDSELRASIPKKGAEQSDPEEENDSHHALTSGDESSSSSSSLSSRNKRKQKRMSTKRIMSRNPPSDDEEGEETYGNEIAVRAPTTSPPPPGHPADPTILPWAQQIGVDAQRMHVMQTSFFRMPEEAAALKELKKPPPSRPTIRKPIPHLSRKHSRESEGDGLRGEPRDRTSFAHDIEPAPHRPFRKFSRVEASSSIAAGHEGAFFDAGLAFGGSFRVGWGPGGTLVHVGTICGPSQTPKKTASSSIVSKTVIPLFHAEADHSASAALSEKLLQHHLSHTPITPDDAGVPLAYPSLYPTVPQASTSDPSLNFASFVSLFPTTDTSTAAQLFRLGSALFDPIDLQLPKKAPSDMTDVTPDIRNRIALLRRKAALSKWLKNAVKQNVESDLQAQASSSASDPLSIQRSASRPEPHTASDEAFTYLTGYQIKKAADVASDAGYLKLATLISQAGGDAVFRADMWSQLKIWEEEKVMQFIERGTQKVYMLLAGLLEGNASGKDKDVDICANLDWKRVFGLCLWYGEPVTASIADVFDAYETLVKNSGGKVARPFASWYDQQHAKKATPSTPLPAWPISSHIQPCDPEDPLYSLIRLHADPALSLSHVLDPASFGLGASYVDWSMCWHMYIILSRVMRVRDFGDREELRSRARSRSKLVADDDGEDEEDEGMEGHSPSADLLASSYAFQLEAQGMLQEAIFVLLHIEGSAGREKAIKDLLARLAPRIDEWTTRGLVGSLKIPLSWVNEAKALHALDTGDVYNAYELYLCAGLYEPAHDIAVQELAPDAIIRRDLDFVQEIFERFEGKEDKIDGWSIKGKILLDYVDTMLRLAALQETASQDPASQTDAPHTQEADELTRRVPKILGLLPDIMSRRHSCDPRHAAAIEQMTKDLIRLVEKTKPLLLSQIQQSTLSEADEATKLGLVKGTGYARFLKSIEIGIYA